MERKKASSLSFHFSSNMFWTQLSSFTFAFLMSGCPSVSAQANEGNHGENYGFHSIDRLRIETSEVSYFFLAGETHAHTQKKKQNKFFFLVPPLWTIGQTDRCGVSTCSTICFRATCNCICLWCSVQPRLSAHGTPL